MGAISGVQDGNASEEGTVNDAVDRRLWEMAQGLKEFVVREGSRGAMTTFQPRE